MQGKYVVCVAWFAVHRLLALVKGWSICCRCEFPVLSGVVFSYRYVSLVSFRRLLEKEVVTCYAVQVAVVLRLRS